MDHLLRMRLPFVCMLVLALAHGGQGLTDCQETRCHRHGPKIRYPFRLKDRQPASCGYPGFDLTCNEMQQMVLELPNSVKLYVQKIDYTSQSIVTVDPDACLARQARNFNLSASPFRYQGLSTFGVGYVFFNCTAVERNSFNQVPCLSSPGSYDVYAFNGLIEIDLLPLASCTKMYTTLLIPDEVVNTPFDTLHLNWTEPGCGSCEAQGQRCRSSTTTTNSSIGYECYFPPRGNQARRKIMMALIIVGAFLLLVVIGASFYIYHSNRVQKENQAKIERFLADYKAMKPARYSYADLKRITSDFKDKLGEGTYGTVFKGKLSREIHVAVKILTGSTGTKNGDEFINEVGTMGRIHHVNVVRLVGFCADGFRRALVYEFLPNESLEKFIFSATDDGGSGGGIVSGSHIHSLGWERLLEIALGIAKGIEYLHQGCEQRILHFDIKPNNILLDHDFNPKIADFGLAKLCAKDQSAITMTAARGTMGYIAPEVFSRNFGNVSYKSDVYSFGMMLLEMVGGRKNNEEEAAADVESGLSQAYFPEWIYEHLDKGEELRIRIEEEGDAKIARKLTIAGLWCIQWYPADRPSMTTVVQMLEGDGEGLSLPPNPFSGGVANGRRIALELEAISEE